MTKTDFLSLFISLLCAGRVVEVEMAVSLEEVQHQACALYFSTLEDLPAIVRQWWTSQDKKLSAIVDRSVALSGDNCASEQILPWKLEWNGERAPPAI